MYRFLTLIAFAFSAFAAPALAEDCVPQFVESSKTVSVNDIDIGARNISRQGFSISVINAGDGDCSAQIRAMRVQGSASRSNLKYSIRSGSSVLDVLPNQTAAATSNSDLFIGGIPSGDSGTNAPFVLSVPSGWGLKSGFHSEQIQLSLLDLTGQVVDTLLLNVNVRVPPAVSMRIVGARGAGGVPTINLGVISSRESAASDPFGVRVWSTSPYQVSFESENRGFLRHEGGLDEIPYDLRMGGRKVDLGGIGTFSFPERTSSLGDVHRLRVRAGPAVARAGNYSDRVTVTVSAI
ncbi:MAG: hypothetical protein Hens2KO_09560 [Henriciella sp.]